MKAGMRMGRMPHDGGEMGALERTEAFPGPFFVRESWLSAVLPLRQTIENETTHLPRLSHHLRRACIQRTCGAVMDLDLEAVEGQGEGGVQEDVRHRGCGEVTDAAGVV